MSDLLQLTLRGSVAILFILGLEAICARHLRASGRRYWWIVVGLAFVFPFKISVLPILAEVAPDFAARSVTPFQLMPFSLLTGPAPLPSVGTSLVLILSVIWGLGAFISLAILIGRTVAVSRRWSAFRLCTDPALLEVLEDCKREAGVSAPIGLVFTDQLTTPAILGWLRPRILLPAAKTRELTPVQLRHVFLHELVHFRSLDVQIGWLFALARCLHWFNPFAYLAERGWARFREEAADEQVLRWAQRQSYGETLMALVPVDGSSPLPGALSVSETFSNLKHRLQRIMNHPIRKSRPSLILLGLAVFGALVFLQSSHAEMDPKTAALAATESWLQGIDAGDYPQSWQDASAAFQKAISKENWVQALQSVRTPLGKLISRKQVSSLHQTEVPSPAGTLKGDFMITQFETSFENAKYTVETVTFEKDGAVWKASGYYIKPR